MTHGRLGNGTTIADRPTVLIKATCGKSWGRSGAVSICVRGQMAHDPDRIIGVRPVKAHIIDPSDPALIEAMARAGAQADFQAHFPYEDWTALTEAQREADYCCWRNGLPAALKALGEFELKEAGDGK